ncbi:PHD finger protein MALE STERILITY 1 [Hibiscus syriacus]|uniref:PHD finger protein MALE STERILITY 1 n=1 Tax=Hibiscus syriacus TaxID=106335 RepID=UPI0019240E16|nr:PHD finger protein MALE STERILITY 1 [Hibiscus syriacus]
MSSYLDGGGGCRKRRRGGERIFKFKSFGENGCPVEFDGSFRNNVKALVEYGNLEMNLCNDGVLCWTFQLEVHRHPPLNVLLFVVEEPVRASSINLHCKHCRYVGWGNHMICNKKYHFLLPSKDTVASCFNCDETNSYESNPEKGKLNLVELKGHIMHGVFHSNGFGHLLCVNGMEMGSDQLAGYQITEFWDRLCTGLQARKVSLCDTSRKRGMELRLLYGVAYGHPWFGRWGYKFGRGCYGVNKPIYQKAIEAIQGIPLCLLNHHLSISNNEVSVIFSRYQALSDHSIVTLGDLLHFMLKLRSRLPEENITSSCNPTTVETNCRWSPKRVEAATRVIVEALKNREFRWVSRQEVRDAARAYIGDTGLLDFVLKSLGNHIVGNYLVRRCLNPVTKVLEYCLEDISTVFPNSEALIMNNSKAKPRNKITKVQLMKDIGYLYKHILNDQKPTMSTGVLSAIPMATRIILDTKFLLKEYTEEQLPIRGNSFKLFCTVTLRNNEGIDEGSKKPMLPYECVSFNENTTFDELRQEVEKCFREVYWRLRSFVVEAVANMSVKGSDLVVGSVEMGQKLVFIGSNDDQIGSEDSSGTGIVDCLCGAKEDDGERLISCDICEVWQHTRCVRIPNNEEIPHVFLCKQCEEKIVFLSSSLP